VGYGLTSLDGLDGLGGLARWSSASMEAGWRSATFCTTFASAIGTELSHETINKITDEVLEEVLAWQRRHPGGVLPGSSTSRDRGEGLRRAHVSTGCGS